MSRSDDKQKENKLSKGIVKQKQEKEKKTES
jgi:hypothetical protein